jgi:hypothetical protein
MLRNFCAWISESGEEARRCEKEGYKYCRTRLVACLQSESGEISCLISHGSRLVEMLAETRHDSPMASDMIHCL